MLIAVLNEDEHAVERWSSVDTALLPAPVLGELLYGALRSSHADQNEERVRELVDEIGSIPRDRYARLRAALASLRKPIPENGLWVAACALAAAATLVTRDTHFEDIQHRGPYRTKSQGLAVEHGRYVLLLVGGIVTSRRGAPQWRQGTVPVGAWVNCPSRLTQPRTS